MQTFLQQISKHFTAKKRIDYILQIIKNISQNSNSSILYRKKKNNNSFKQNGG